MENFDLLNSLIFPYANLIVFCILAYLVLRKPILNALASKRQAYVSLMERANKARDEAEQKQRELESKLKDLDRQVEQIKADVKIQAEEEAKGILQGAQTLAEHLKNEAKRIAEAEIAAAKAEVQREILQQVRQHTAEEIQKSLDDTRHHQVVQQGLTDISRIKEIQL